MKQKGKLKKRLFPVQRVAKVMVGREDEIFFLVKMFFSLYRNNIENINNKYEGGGGGGKYGRVCVPSRYL